MVSGIYSPLPPCFYSQSFNSTCEEAVCCRKCGSIGFASCRQNRGNLMMLATFLSLCAVIFQIVPVLAVSKATGTIQNVAWAVGELPNDHKIYVGLSSFVVCEDGSNCESYEWNSDTCPSNVDTTNATSSVNSTGVDTSSAGSYCSDCETACQSTYMVAIMALVTSIPQLTTDIQRSTIEGDVNCQKFLGIFTGLLGTATTLASLSTFADGCHANLPEGDFLNMGEVSWALGPSFVILLLATLLKPLDVIFHCIVPVPVTKIEEAYNNLTWKAQSDPDYLRDGTASA